MTLDEAIKQAEEVMLENLEKTKDRNASDPIAINSFECADEHRQIAEWLKELKRLREQTESEKRGDCVSRQAVIDRINRLIEVEKKQGTDDWGYGQERVNAYEAMLHFIKSEYLYPSVEPEQSQCSWYGEDGRCHFAEQEMDECEDCISRTELLKNQKIIIDEHGLAHKIVHIGRIMDAPSVEPARKPGKWIKVVNPDTNEWPGGFKCSECDRGCVQMSMNYCANCGAPMEEHT